MAATLQPAEITLALPSRLEYGRVARVGAAHLAHRRGFTLREIDDLRILVDEAIILLLGPSPLPGHIDVRYRVEPDLIDIDLQSLLDDEHRPLPPDRMARFDEITDGLADDITVWADERRVRVAKRHVNPD